MFQIIEWTFTVFSNLAIAVIICSRQEGFGLLVSQNSSPRNKPLQKKSGRTRVRVTHRSQQSPQLQKQWSGWKIMFWNLNCGSIIILPMSHNITYTQTSVFCEWPLTHLSSSSSIKPLASLSKIPKTFLTSWGLFLVSPQIWKNFLGQKESGAGGVRDEVEFRNNDKTDICHLLTTAWILLKV